MLDEEGNLDHGAVFQKQLPPLPQQTGEQVIDQHLLHPLLGGQDLVHRLAEDILPGAHCIGHAKHDELLDHALQLVLTPMLGRHVLPRPRPPGRPDRFRLNQGRAASPFAAALQ